MPSSCKDIRQELVDCMLKSECVKKGNSNVIPFERVSTNAGAACLISGNGSELTAAESQVHDRLKESLTQLPSFNILLFVMDADLHLQYDDNAFMKKILSDLLSHNDIARRRVLNTYYLPNAKLTSPLVSIYGLEKIKNVFALTTALSIRPPVITNVVFDNKTCAVQLVSFLKVPLVPLTLNVPSWTVLHFKETDLDSRLLKVWWHEESWTIEGILQAMPIVSKFYSSMIRAGIGKVLAGTGKLLETVAGGPVSHSYDLPTRTTRQSRCSLFKTILISWSDFLTRAKLIVPRPIHKPVDPYQRQRWILQQQSETLGFTCLPPRYITNF